MFEIKAKDMRGRVGVLKTKHGDVKTPNLMPVIHPRKQTINVKDYGADILSVYGDVDITNKEVIEFQEAIGTDIGTSLDIPTGPYVDREKAEEDLEITIERAKEAISFVKDNDYEMKINSVVQGSTYPDLREYCATELTKLDADLYPIGAVVPLMEMYHYRDLVDAVMHSVKCCRTSYDLCTLCSYGM